MVHPGTAALETPPSPFFEPPKHRPYPHVLKCSNVASVAFERARAPGGECRDESNDAQPGNLRKNRPGALKTPPNLASREGRLHAQIGHPQIPFHPVDALELLVHLPVQPGLHGDPGLSRRQMIPRASGGGWRAAISLRWSYLSPPCLHFLRTPAARPAGESVSLKS